MPNVYIIDDSEYYANKLESLLKTKLPDDVQFKVFDATIYNDKGFIDDLLHLKIGGRNFETDLAIIDTQLTISDHVFWTNLDKSHGHKKEVKIFQNKISQIHGDNLIRAIRYRIDSKMKIVSITSWLERDMKRLRGENCFPFREDKYYRHFQKKGVNIEAIANDIISFYNEII